MTNFTAFFAAFCLLATNAHALNCTSKDTEQLKVMYKAYVKSGFSPQAQLLDHSLMGTAVSVNGIVTGPKNYEACWKNNPPCNAQPDNVSATINFITTNDEVRSIYDGDATNALSECFRKLGLGAQPRESNNVLGGVLR